MQRTIKYISILVITLLSSSCRVMDVQDQQEPLPDHFITGKVTYLPEGSIIERPIEHIKVTFDWGHGIQEDIQYTSGDGIFYVEIPEEITSAEIPVNITLEDIDGEDNEGLFETFSDNIIYSIDPQSPTGFITYRLTRATASESSPQS